MTAKNKKRLIGFAVAVAGVLAGKFAWHVMDGEEQAEKVKNKIKG